MNWLRRVFCKHDWKFVRNIYGDEIIARGYKRSEWVCSKCGKFRYRAALAASETPG